MTLGRKNIECPDGFDFTSGERIDGAAGLAATVFDASGTVAYSLTISGPAVRMPLATRLLGGAAPDPS